MTRPITEKQKQAIKFYVSKGYSANKIQKKLQQRHMGMRRQRLLRYNRIYRRQVPKAHPEKYHPHPQRQPMPFQKTVTLRGRWKGEPKIRHKTGTGRDLYNFVRNEMAKAEEGKGWDAKPDVFS